MNSAPFLSGSDRVTSTVSHHGDAWEYVGDDTNGTPVFRGPTPESHSNTAFRVSFGDGIGATMKLSLIDVGDETTFDTLELGTKVTMLGSSGRQSGGCGRSTAEAVSFE